MRTASMLSRATLRRAARRNPDGVRRLAVALRLRIDGMSARQVAALVYWRLSRRG